MRFGIGTFLLLTGLVWANPTAPTPPVQPVQPPPTGQSTTIRLGNGGTITSGSGNIIINGRQVGQNVVQPVDPERAKHESETQTIAKCIADMKNADAEVRLRAILILGKYNRNFNAINAVTAALKDSDAAVRRAALVALTEGTSVSTATTPHILRMLDDSDVHIRRIASSFLRQAMLYYRYVSSSQAAQQQAVIQETRPTVIAAFRDEDATVRRNMMNSIVYFAKFNLPRSVIAQGLRDEDREVRILSLQALGQFSNENFLADLKPLTKDPDQKIRFHVADMLANLGDDKEVLALLGELAQDEDFDVSTSAIMGLLQAVKDGREYAAELRKRLDDPRLNETTAREFIRIVAFSQGRDYDAMIMDILAHNKASYRQMALESIAVTSLNDLPVDALLKGVRDSAESVRSTALRYLGRVSVPVDSVADLATSEHSDVRRFVATYVGGSDMSTRQPRYTNEQMEPIVFELLLDDDDQVRRTAIRSIVSRQLPDWEFIAEETLLNPEDDYSTQQYIVSLMRVRTAQHGILRKALTSPTLNPNLRTYITSVLRVGQRPPTRVVPPQSRIQTTVRPPTTTVQPRPQPRIVTPQVVRPQPSVPQPTPKK